MDLDEARDLAWVFLHRDPGRWRHVEGVAARAWELRSAVPPEDVDRLVAAAWTHDIGYSPVLRDRGFHPLDGGRYLASAGHEHVAALVAHHSGARFVADLRGLGDELSRFPFTEDPLTDALTCADQTAGPDGRPLTVADRLADTARRHGPDAPTTRVRHLREPYILAAVERTTQRLRRSRRILG